MKLIHRQAKLSTELSTAPVDNFQERAQERNAELSTYPQPLLLLLLTYTCITRKKIMTKIKTTTKPIIHPNCPKKLAAAYHFARNQRGEGYKIRVLEQKLGVNWKYLHRLIKLGIEPNDTTEKLRSIRKAMFLPARKRIPAKPRTIQPMPDYMAWWKKQSKGFREQIIKNTYDMMDNL